MSQSCVPIDKLTLWRAGTWVRYEAKPYNLSVCIHCDQLLILNNNKLLESLNMNGKIKGIYKEDVLILVISTGVQEIRKIKFQILTRVGECLQKLGEHFPVINHNSSKSGTEKYRNIDGIFKAALDECGSKIKSSISPLPTNFSSFVKLCLLDPAFPSFVQQTQKIIDMNLLNNK